MDLQMPEMDDFECTAEIRKNSDKQINSLPIIAITANVMNTDKQRCLEAGMNDYLKKPVHMEELQQALASFNLS